MPLRNASASALPRSISMSVFSHSAVIAGEVICSGRTQTRLQPSFVCLLYTSYQMYINWVPMDEGNVLYNDKKFATLLYQWHCDAFTEYSKVSDAGAFVKNNIYDFIDDSEKTVLVVDCENSDPYKLCATLKNLDYEVMHGCQGAILSERVRL